MRGLREAGRLLRAGLAQQQRSGFAVRSGTPAMEAAESAAAKAGADAAVANGVPPMQEARKVIIYTPARTAGQQGQAQTAEGGGPAWQVQFENTGKWINPLIGWTSTADPMENVARPMHFDSKDAAIAFAERNGWKHEVEEPNLRSRARPKRYVGYGDNYSVKRKGLPVGGLRSELTQQKK